MKCFCGEIIEGNTYRGVMGAREMERVWHIANVAICALIIFSLLMYTKAGGSINPTKGRPHDDLLISLSAISIVCALGGVAMFCTACCTGGFKKSPEDIRNFKTQLGAGAAAVGKINRAN